MISVHMHEHNSSFSMDEYRCMRMMCLIRMYLVRSKLALKTKIVSPHVHGEGSGEMLSFYGVLLRLALALVLGAAIGAEREIRLHEAGLRTMALVSVGACLFQIVAFNGFIASLTLPHAQFDPSRIASYIVAGIGFLGAGCIFRSHEESRVRGLTTAATIWVVAAIGLAAGCGLILIAIAATVLTLIVLTGLRLGEQAFSLHKTGSARTLLVEVTSVGGKFLGSIYDACARFHIKVESIEVQEKPYGDIIKVSCKGTGIENFVHVVDELHAMPEVHAIRLSQSDVDRLHIGTSANE